MKINELRIGNLLVVDDDIVTEVTVIGEDYLGTTKTIGFINIEKFSPIILTPEILEKCGFNVTSKGFYVHPNWYNISLKFMRGTYNLRCNFMDIIANNIDYLHQLQNLYFALTGEELLIKL
jgi:hypothetical protein